MWAVNHFRVYLYGHDVIVYSDHSAVKAVLETPNPSGKHARWWLKVFGSGLKSINIVYKAGKENTSADALSRNPHGQVPQGAEVEQIQVASIQTTDLTVRDLLDMCPESSSVSINSFQFNFAQEQRKDSDLSFMFNFLVHNKLPSDEQNARKVAAQALHFCVVDNILYFVDPKNGGRKRSAVPKHLREQRATAVLWLAISLAKGCTRLCHATGGGQECIATSLHFVSLVHSVL